MGWCHLIIAFAGFFTAIGISAFSVFLFDFTVGLSFWTYLASFIISFPVYALTLFKLAKTWHRIPSYESLRKFNRGLWKTCLLIAAGMALITLLVIELFYFL